MIDRLKCKSLQAPFNYAIHCKPIQSEYDMLTKLHSVPVMGQPGMTLYSAATYEPMNIDQLTIARQIALELCNCLDFPRLIQLAYNDGTRIFIELGAGSNCARWINDTLQGQPHAAYSINRKGVDDFYFHPASHGSYGLPARPGELERDLSGLVVMQKLTPESILKNYGNRLAEHTRQSVQVHDRFLELRKAGLRQLAGTIEQQVRSSRALDSGHANALFTLEDLNEFATGSVVKCLGPDYAIYAGRRSPRIPNNELLLMSRILSIRGRKGEFDQPSGIVAEYEVPADAWYLDDEPRGHLPYSICIELALQPCGFLSAYLGTPLRFPDVDYYFRNLDGEAVFHRMVDARGKTVRTRAELLKTIFYGSTIIQHFSFELDCDGEVFFAGKSSFGYFSAEDMAAQTGLDGGKTVLPWVKQAGQENRIVPIAGTALQAVLPRGKLCLLDGVVIDKGAGHHREGYVYANRSNHPQDWFYACHFQGRPGDARFIGDRGNDPGDENLRATAVRIASRLQPLSPGRK